MPIYFMRHAKSFANEGIGDKKDSPISDSGIIHSSLLSGRYDLVVLSNLRRSKQTLINSNIKYTDVIITDLCREFKAGDIGDVLEHEDENILENKHDFNKRINNFKIYLDDLNTKYENILVISHGYFIISLLHLEDWKRNLYNCEIVFYK